MRIVYLCADRGVPIGGVKGAAIHVRGVAQALARRGHEIHLLAARGDGPLPDGFLPEVSLFGRDRMLRHLRHGILEGAPSEESLAREAHGFALNIPALEALDRLDRTLRIDALYERLSLWSLAGLRFARSRGIPWILEVNAPLVEEQRRYRSLGLHPLARGLELMLLAEADAIVAPSMELRAHIERRAGRRRRVVVIPNGVDLETFAAPAPIPAERAARLRGGFVIAFAGSLKPWHGIEILLAAFRRLRRRVPQAHLLVIGEGPMLSWLSEAAAGVGPDAVTITGAVPHEQVPAWLACAHVGVAPYPRLTNFYFSPLKVVEYMAAGLPVVGSDIGQIPALVRNGETGLLVPPGRVKPLAEALLRLHRDRRLRERLARCAGRRARRHHGWDRVAEKVEALLRNSGAREGEPGRSRSAAVPRALAVQGAP